MRQMSAPGSPKLVRAMRNAPVVRSSIAGLVDGYRDPRGVVRRCQQQLRIERWQLMTHGADLSQCTGINKYWSTALRDQSCSITTKTPTKDLSPSARNGNFLLILPAQRLCATQLLRRLSACRSALHRWAPRPGRPKVTSRRAAARYDGTRPRVGAAHRPA